MATPAHQTGGEYLRFFARLFGLSRGSVHAARRPSCWPLVGLDDRAGSPISTYSRGMRQRLGIARALVNDPVVVFLDEPTLGLDPAGQAQVLDIIRTIAKGRDATVVLSTHLLPEVEEACSKVVILNHGRVVVSGSVGEVISKALIKQSAQLRVPPDLVERARNALAGFPNLTVDQLAEQPDVLNLAPDTPRSATRAGSGDVMNAALAAVTAAGIPVLRFELEGARLSDAFLKMTSEGWPMTLQVAPPDAGTPQDVRATAERPSGWMVVAEQESRDLWTSGRGLILLLLFSILLSAVTYLTSTNQALNFLEQRESVNLVLQLAVAVGVLVTLVVSADGISGERERGTLESLLVTPVSRRAIIGGKLVAALTMWLATFVVTHPVRVGACSWRRDPGPSVGARFMRRNPGGCRPWLHRVVDQWPM